MPRVPPPASLGAMRPRQSSSYPCPRGLGLLLMQKLGTNRGQEARESECKRVSRRVYFCLWHMWRVRCRTGGRTGIDPGVPDKRRAVIGWESGERDVMPWD